jgi:hypothetical protein
MHSVETWNSFSEPCVLPEGAAPARLQQNEFYDWETLGHESGRWADV